LEGIRKESSHRQQPQEPDQIVSHRLDHKLPTRARERSELGPRHSAGFLDLAVFLFDPLTDALLNLIK
jgi:hypothetical protein